MRYRVVEINGKFYPQRKKGIGFWRNMSCWDAMQAGCDDVRLGHNPWNKPLVTYLLVEAVEVCRRVDMHHNASKKKPVERVVWKTGMPLPPAKNVINSSRG